MRGHISASVRTMAKSGMSSSDIRAVLKSFGVADGGVKTAVHRSRKEGQIAPRAKKNPCMYQITLHPAANERLVKAAEERGLMPADLARIWLHLATRDLT